MFQREWCLFESKYQRLTVSAMCYPHHWGLHWRENGAREPQHVLDTTLMIGPWSFNLTFWHIGRLAWLIGWLHAGRKGRGHHIGW